MEEKKQFVEGPLRELLINTPRSGIADVTYSAENGIETVTIVTTGGRSYITDVTADSETAIIKDIGRNVLVDIW